MRVLLVVLSPIRPELGAAQMALNLARALKATGVDAVVWSPHPVPAGVRWWRRIAWMRRRIVDFVAASGPFDCVDLPPVAVTPSLARTCRVIARTVQPDLAYLWTELRYGPRLRPIGVASGLATAIHNLYLAVLVVMGEIRAAHVLCLGRQEYEWTNRWLPWLRGKLAMYVNAPADEERAALAAIRATRAPHTGFETRFLWIGRWVAHKGADRLLAFIRSEVGPHSGIRVTIAGCGDEPKNRVSADALSSGRVRIVPSFDRRGLVELLAHHDAGLFTSRVEGWGLTLQEMLESGMPVYATDAGAAAELKDAFPRMVRPFPPPASGALDVAGEQAPSRDYLERYAWDAIARDYLAIIGAPARHARAPA